ncbi:hypothetical protein ACIBMX_14675 [Streptomyces phaeochromogenes]|uniref:hypothetical protein n=1 Tax=Streptomyces phaeochromogenes TaxID=1923 RepID=UPI0033F37EED
MSIQWFVMVGPPEQRRLVGVVTLFQADHLWSPSEHRMQSRQLPPPAMLLQAPRAKVGLVCSLRH